MSQKPTRSQLTGVERTFDADEFIVSKTDVKGHITYANSVFLRISGYEEDEVLGRPHSMIRHSDMPRCIFRLLWERIQSGREIFAYVVNAAKNGDHYWVLAHVTPTFDMNGNTTGFHSNRRKPRAEQVATVKPLYDRLVALEDGHANRRQGLEESTLLLNRILSEKGLSYDEFVLSA